MEGAPKNENFQFKESVQSIIDVAKKLEEEKAKYDKGEDLGNTATYMINLVRNIGNSVKELEGVIKEMNYPVIDIPSETTNQHEQ